MNQKIYIALLAILTACTFTSDETVIPKTFTTQYNQAIDQEMRAEIALKNDELIASIAINNASAVTKLSSDYLINNDPEGFNRVIELASDLIQIPTYSILSEYYTTTSFAEKKITIESNRIEPDTNDFSLTYTSPNQETYVSLLLSDAGHGQRLVTVIYSKYQTEWKIDYLHFTNYSLYGKTAPQYYYASQEAYFNNDLLGSYTLMLLSNLCNKPGGEIFDYMIQSDLDEHYEKLPTEVSQTLNLPITVNEIDTKPQITGIAIVPLAGYQYIPMVSYITHIDFTDEDAIHNECDALNANLNRILPGFTWQFNQVLFQAMDKSPVDNDEVQNLNVLKNIQFIEQPN